MKAQLLLCNLGLIFSQTSLAFSVRECDEHFRIQKDPTGRSFLMLPGGGNNQYTSWEWIALTEEPDGTLVFPATAKVVWKESTLVLQVKSARWNEETRNVTCLIAIDSPMKTLL